MSLPQSAVGADERFWHQALLYSGTDELVAALESFVTESLSSGDKVLVVLSAPKLAALRAALGNKAAGVSFADTDCVGANPARIIPFWSSFVTELAPGQRARGVGEPVGPARRPAELAECQVHESLLNLAFAQVPRFWLLCPYDTSTLIEAVLDEARRSHAFISAPTQPPRASNRYVASQMTGALSRDDLPPAPPEAQYLRVDAGRVASARRLVRVRAGELGLCEAVAGDFALAVHEVVANSLKHGRGHSELYIWEDGESIVCDVRDQGRFEEPLAGRRRPVRTGAAGRGLWMANQLCDLVQIRTGQGGTAVRLHLNKPAGRSYLPPLQEASKG
jgi:anti-sigma regulatory factor (Ser/Thr protein kinase)